MRVSPWAIVIGGTLLLASPAAGQTPPVCAQTATATPDSTAIPIVILARIHADAVVFESEPDVRVTLNGCDPLPGQVRHTSSLPDTIVPGVRYTNVEVTAEYRAWLTIECRAPEDVAAQLCAEISRRD